MAKISSTGSAQANNITISHSNHVHHPQSPTHINNGCNNTSTSLTHNIEHVINSSSRDSSQNP